MNQLIQNYQTTEDVEIALAATIQLVARGSFVDVADAHSAFEIVQTAPEEKQLNYYQLLSRSFIEYAQAPLLAQYLATFGGYAKQDVARVVFGDMTPEQYRAQKNNAALTDPELRKLVENIVKQNFGMTKINSSVAQATTQLSLSQALKQYRSIGDQVLTDGPIEIRGRSDLAPGTVKNWVYDYRDNLGGTKHSAMERGNYLFNSKNTKRLEPRDRHAVALVLKSLDEGTPLAIDTANHKITFEQSVPEQKTGIQTPQTPPHQDMYIGGTGDVAVKKPHSGVEQKLLARQNMGTDRARQPRDIHKNTATAQPDARDAFRSLHHKEAVTQQPKTPSASTQSQQPTPEIAFSSKQQLPIEQMAKNVRQKMRSEDMPKQSKPQPRKKKPRKTPFRMKPIK